VDQLDSALQLGFKVILISIIWRCLILFSWACHLCNMKNCDV
jgi:hypothetical protein